jgi:hypothetical protein
MSAIPTERFELSAAPAAAEGYPMEVIDGEFSAVGGTGFPVAPGFLEGDWGLSHIGWGEGDPMQPVPDSLWVRWFSYPEDKFYEGHFLLPQQRLHTLLKQGYWNTDDKRHDTYHTLTLCLLPTGVVVVWLTGQNQVLVGRYQGHEIYYDFKRFNAGADRARMIAQERAKLPPAVQQQIKTHTLSTQRWDNYLKTYNWQVAFSQPVELAAYGVDYVDAESIAYPPSPDMAGYLKAALALRMQPVPSRLLLRLNAGYGRKRTLKVTFSDEAETLAAFQKLHAHSPSQPLTLYFDTDEQVSKVRVSLKNDSQQLELTKAKVEIYATH